MASTMEGNGALSGAVIVLLPAEIDMTNAEHVATRLRDAIASGAHTVVADLTETTFCDSAGIRGLSLAHQRAAESGSRLNLAVTADSPVGRVLDLMDLTSVLHVYPSVRAAAAAATSGG
jgi:anti-sigma B factor antagonist